MTPISFQRFKIAFIATADLEAFVARTIEQFAKAKQARQTS